MSPLDRLDDIEARLAAASPRPWHLYRASSDDLWITSGEQRSISEITIASSIPYRDDALFFKSSADDIDWLCSQLRAVLELHRPDRDDEWWCDGCGTVWPCPTLAAMTNCTVGDAASFRDSPHRHQQADKQGER